MNAFTKPAQSFALGLQKKGSEKGGQAAAKKARGVAVPSLSNQRGVSLIQKPWEKVCRT